MDYIQAIELSSIGSAALTGGYDVVSTGLSSPCLILRIINDSSKGVIISYDGATDNDYVASGSSVTINAQANNKLPGLTALFRKGLPVYVKGTAGTGNIYVAGYHI